MRRIFAHFTWTKHDSTQITSRPTMESTSTTGLPDDGFISKQNEEPNIVTINNEITSPELSTSLSTIAVKPTVSQVSEEYERKMVPLKPNHDSSISNNEKYEPVEDNLIKEELSDEDVLEDNTLVNAKDSRLLLMKESSTEGQNTNRKKISFNDSEDSSNAYSMNSDSNDDMSIMSVAPSRSVNGRVVGRMLVEGSDEPMRCWMTEGDHPVHPATENCADNIKVITNRVRESADSILRDSDEFLLAERRLTKQVSLPKKVSISDEPPTTYISDIPPEENPKIDQDEDPIVKMEKEAELASAAAAALKENWRKKTDLEPVDLEDEDKIIFGDTNVVEEGQILQISDDEASDKEGTKEDII